nr:MAG TPA: immunity protein [Caudoviricetes sp.]
MITIAEAKKLAAGSYNEYPIREILDIGDRWAFRYDSGVPPVPGVPTVTVDKETGEVEWLTVPPLENLALLNAGKVVTEQGD